MLGLKSIRIIKRGPLWVFRLTSESNFPIWSLLIIDLSYQTRLKQFFVWPEGEKFRYSIIVKLGHTVSVEISELFEFTHYNDVIVGAMASQIISLTIVYSTVYSGADQRKHQSSAPMAFVRGIHRWPMTSPHKGPATRKIFPFDAVVMSCNSLYRYVLTQ